MQVRELQRQEREAAQRKLEKTRNAKIMKKALRAKASTGTIRSAKSLTLVITERDIGPCIQRLQIFGHAALFLCVQPVAFTLQTAERPRAVDKTAETLMAVPPAPKIDTTAGLTQPQPFNLHVRMSYFHGACQRRRYLMSSLSRCQTSERAKINHSAVPAEPFKSTVRFRPKMPIRSPV